MSSTLFGGILTGVVVLWLAGKLFRRWAVARYTVMSDLPALGTPRQDGQKVGQTAIVCGGSVAGLLAARVCSDHFNRVLVVDPDATTLVAGAQASTSALKPPPHARVMQYELFHTVQAIFVHGLSKLFPGTLERELAAAGAVVGSGNFNAVIGGVALHAPFEQLPAPAQKAVGLTRAAYETILRRMVAADKRIEFVDGTLLGFDVDASNAKKLAWIRYRPSSDAKAVVTLKGDLVIDCTGVAHAGLSLLQRASPSFALPKDAFESYQPKMRYTSCTFENTQATMAPYFEHADGFDKGAPVSAFFIPVASMETRWLGFARIQGDRMLVLAGGAGFSGAIESVADLRVHAQAIWGLKPLPSWVFAVIDNLEAQEADHPGHYMTGNITPMHQVKYHDHPSSLPVNFVALGDASKKLNPVFGQGMAKTMVEATTLDAVLRASTDSAIGPTYFTKAAHRTGSVWTSTKIGDYANDTCEPVPGETRALGARQRKFNSAIGKRALAGDKDIQRRMMGLRSWVYPHTDMVAPSVLLRLAADYVRGR